ncbi:unnamed protein product [Lymnaea stagnalis]|uniref:Uncharacterized protein n=1 Tax=Lymnaea stagnalis TaxID=6523 RepID=A0AAV2HGU4_LYMST
MDSVTLNATTDNSSFLITTVYPAIIDNSSFLTTTVYPAIIDNSSFLSTTAHRIYFGVGLGCGLLVLLTLVAVTIIVTCCNKRTRPGGPRIGRMVSYANSDFDTYRPVNVSVFSTPKSRSMWDHRQQPSSPSPTITTISNRNDLIYGINDKSIKMLDDIFGPQKRMYEV